MDALDAALDGLLGPEKLEAPETEAPDAELSPASETEAPDAELSPAPAPSDKAVIDFEKLVQESGRELIVELIEMLERQLPELDTQISIAIEEEDADRLRLAAHTLKGSLALFGASSASEAAKRLEEMARSTSLDGAEDAQEELRRQLDEVRDVLGPIKRNLIAGRDLSPTQDVPAAR
jgi:HPt (histidine-containing phosphotransfer) domain-containing protein